MAKKAARKAPAKRSTVAKTLHQVRFPGESAKYRTARNALLKSEMALRAQIE